MRMSMSVLLLIPRFTMFSFPPVFIVFLTPGSVVGSGFYYVDRQFFINYYTDSQLYNSNWMLPLENGVITPF